MENWWIYSSLLFHPQLFYGRTNSHVWAKNASTSRQNIILWISFVRFHSPKYHKFKVSLTILTWTSFNNKKLFTWFNKSAFLTHKTILYHFVNIFLLVKYAAIILKFTYDYIWTQFFLYWFDLIIKSIYLSNFVNERVRDSQIEHYKSINQYYFYFSLFFIFIFILKILFQISYPILKICFITYFMNFRGSI